MARKSSAMFHPLGLSVFSLRSVSHYRRVEHFLKLNDDVLFHSSMKFSRNPKNFCGIY